ncbi:hypothetical protein M011DRAFT_78440 [Sporormia fimetaria CBS 119925]|uniref:Uncharacterized protein n=1 Tax=Sporormia fimetaria CBS 119925 TaxID=1340428 RepID=A0A6A6V9K1_9PLEO|nr:hypothetical protein M011DRAFT_78440 [Sporormia fimetaria CBS 119925]
MLCIHKRRYSSSSGGGSMISVKLKLNKVRRNRFRPGMAGFSRMIGSMMTMARNQMNIPTAMRKAFRYRAISLLGGCGNAFASLAVGVDGRGLFASAGIGIDGNGLGLILSLPGRGLAVRLRWAMLETCILSKIKLVVV